MSGKILNKLKRFLVAFLCMVFCMSLVAIPAYAQGEVTGEWVLVGSPKISPPKYDVPPGTKDKDGDLYETSVSISDGSGSYNDKKTYARIGPDDGKPLMYSLAAATVSFTKPPARMKPGEQLTFSLSGVLNPIPDDYYCIDSIDVELDTESVYILNDGSGDYLSGSEGFGKNAYLQFFDPGTKSQTCTYTVPSYNEDAKQLAIAFAIEGDNGRQEIGYFYEFKASSQRQVDFSGRIIDIKGNIMPYLLVAVDGELNDNGKKTEIPETLVQTDVTGVFQWKGEVPLQAKGKLTLRARIYMQCWLKDYFNSRTDKTAFFFTDLNAANKSAPIYAATTVNVDLSSPEYKSSEPIVINRYIDFMFTRFSSPFLSLQDKDTRDQFDTNASSATSVAAMSYLYNQAFSGLYTGVKTFGEKDALTQNAPILRIETNGPEAESTYCHGDLNTPYIRLCESDTTTTDLARFDILHEYGHWFDFITNNNGQLHCTPANAASVNVNHGGYMNDDTSDSVLEGFASWYCCITQKTGFFPVATPALMSVFGSAAQSSLAWSVAGKQEEFSVTRALWVASELMGAKEVWDKAMSAKHNSLSEYYADLINACPKPEDANAIKQAFFSNGLYKLDAGNGAYDVGEPFRDDPSVQNGKPNAYDPGDTFADIPTKLPSSAAEAKKLGEPADSKRVRSVSLFRNSYIKLTGSIPEYVIVSIQPEQGDAYTYSVNVRDSGVYVGLPADGGAGKVTISVPGGETIYTGDTAVLHKKLMQSFGTDSSLESVKVPASALPAEPVIVGPTDGVVGSNGIINVTEERLSPAEEMSYNPSSFVDMDNSELESIIQTNSDHVSSMNAGEQATDFDVSGGSGGSGSNGGSGGTDSSHDENDAGNEQESAPYINTTIIIIVVAAVVVAAGLIIILILISNKKKKQLRPPYAQPQQYQYPNTSYPNQNIPQQGPPYNQPTANYGFCRQCGSPLSPDGSCMNCKPRQCPACGSTCQPGEKFCRTCGRSL